MGPSWPWPRGRSQPFRRRSDCCRSTSWWQCQHGTCRNFDSGCCESTLGCPSSLLDRASLLNVQFYLGYSILDLVHSKRPRQQTPEYQFWMCSRSYHILRWLWRQELNRRWSVLLRWFRFPKVRIGPAISSWLSNQRAGSVLHRLWRPDEL